MIKGGNLFDGLPRSLAHEDFATLLTAPGFRLERIVSTGHATPEGAWYDQPEAEWVLLLRGGARLLIEGEPQARRLRPGDWLLIPAHLRHRVEWTDPAEPTFWLALHHGG